MRRFPGLDFIRFYAALSVIVYHVINGPNVWFGHPPVLPSLQLFFMQGTDAVVCFFTLSGFLITYLLLSEKSKHGTINVKGFYRRRILRIWPLYFTVVFIGLVLIPILFPNTPAQSPNGILNVLLVLALMPNVVYSLLWKHVIAHLWSIGVEEQAYLCLPILIRNSKYLPLVLWTVIAVRWLFFGLANASGNEGFRLFAVGARFDCMAIGGLGAYLAFHNHFLLRVLYHPVVQLCAIGLFLFNLAYNTGGMVYDFLHACIFMVYILNVATNPIALGRIDFSFTPLLGSLSYGMYMLHPLVLYTLAWLLPIGADTTLMVGTIALTLVAAYTSYRWLELPFLRMKWRTQTTPPPKPVSVAVGD